MHVKLFWDFVDSSGGPDACWLWLKGRSRPGYGVVNLRFDWSTPGLLTVRTHRVAWCLANGQDVRHLTESVLHACDNPSCCNPAHLFLGSQADNIADMDAKERRGVQRGEARPAHKLTEVDVIAARIAYEAGDSTPVLAARYGVTVGAMYNALTGKTWRYLPAAVTKMRSSTHHLHGH